MRSGLPLLMCVFRSWEDFSRFFVVAHEAKRLTIRVQESPTDTRALCFFQSPAIAASAMIGAGFRRRTSLANKSFSSFVRCKKKKREDFTVVVVLQKKGPTSGAWSQ